MNYKYSYNCEKVALHLRVGCKHSFKQTDSQDWGMRMAPLSLPISFTIFTAKSTTMVAKSV